MLMVPRKKVGPGVDSLRSVSLFMKGFLGCGLSRKNPLLGFCLGVMGQVEGPGREKWENLTKRALFNTALQEFRLLFKRPLTELEKLFVSAELENFMKAQSVIRSIIFRPKF